MPFPIIGPAWDFLSSFAYDTALNLTEMASLGQHGWYWRLHAAARRLYWRDTAFRVLMREGAGSGLPPGQCVYGETPVLSFLSILSRAEVSPDDTVFDLGCGRGLALLGAVLHFDVHGVGIEALPTFVTRAQELARTLHVADRARFVLGDFLAQDLTGGTVFYAASTTFSAGTMAALADRVAAHNAGRRPIRFITLSQRLGPPWEPVDETRLPMSWGWNTVYFHVLK